MERMTLVWHDGSRPPTRVWAPRGSASPERSLQAHGSAPPRADALDHARPRHAALALGDRKHEVVAERELRTELMELFTLGAGRGYTERDVLEQARALRLPERVARRRRPTRFRFRPGRHDSDERVFGRRAGSTGATPSTSVSSIRALPSRLPSLGLLHPTKPPRATQRAPSALLPAPVRRSPVVAAILKHPTSTRDRGGEAPVV